MTTTLNCRPKRCVDLCARSCCTRLVATTGFSRWIRAQRRSCWAVTKNQLPLAQNCLRECPRAADPTPLGIAAGRKAALVQDALAAFRLSLP